MKAWQREFAATIDKHRRQGWGWRYDGLDDWPSEAIFAKLQELGIDTDAERFRQQAAAASGIDALRRGWDDQIREEMDTGFWPDFPLIAAPLLWERLTPDLICREIIGERLYRAIQAAKEGTDLPAVESVPAAVAAVAGLAGYLEGFPAVERAERFDEINREGVHDCDGWMLDVIQKWGRDYPDVMTKLADVMTDGDNGINFQADVASLLATMGRRDQAVQRARAIVDRFHDDPWSWIFAGDVYEELGDFGEAKRLYIEALAIVREPMDWEAAAERLKCICKEPGGVAELEEVLRRHPAPKRKLVSPTVVPKDMPAPPARAATPTLPPKKKIGRNDPCPCGSRKKYKKCCGG